MFDEENPRPPFPPFDREAAETKIQKAEDAWNTKDPKLVVQAYTLDTTWRNRNEFFNGRQEVYDFLEKKWATELNYKLKKELWAFTENRISVKFFYEWHNSEGRWFRSYGNEQWEFADNGLMRRREASINDLMIDESERQLQ